MEKKANAVWLHLYEGPRVIRVLETESRTAGAGLAAGSYYLMGSEFPFHKTKSFGWMVATAAQECHGLSATELHTEKLLRWSILCCIYFTTISKISSPNTNPSKGSPQYKDYRADSFPDSGASRVRFRFRLLLPLPLFP